MKGWIRLLGLTKRQERQRCRLIWRQTTTVENTFLSSCLPARDYFLVWNCLLHTAYYYRSNYSFVRSSPLRPAVCLSVGLSVTFMRPTLAIAIFGSVSIPFDTLAIYWLSPKILGRSFQGNPSVGDVKLKRGSRI